MAELGGVAVIGLSGRFPGARNVQAFWRNLVGGVESITSLSREELVRAGVAAEDLADPDFVPAGAFLDDIDRFDASFFGYSPAEARMLDPQHRFFLECAWEALEDAGYPPEATGGQVGVFAGASLSLYPQQKRATSSPRGALQLIPELEELLGNDKDYLSTRVSYKLDLRGPSVNVQTACSTSLVAISMACNALLSFQCDLALAGGVTLRVPHRTGYLTGGSRIGSRDGHCRPFDAAGQGPVFGNGVGVVVLKRLEEAIAARDHIYAVVRGSAVNNDGAAKVGFTAPSVEGQAQVVAMALALAETPADTIGYVEAHGTGTALGDPIEVAALTRAFGTRPPGRARCALGSVKANVGHLESAAGVTGFIKTVLALENRLLPPTLHFRQANPELGLENSPFHVNDTLSEWHSDGTPRRAGVSSFGLGGTNAHVILEEAPELPPVDRIPPRPFHLLTLSARSRPALREAAARLAEHLASTPSLELEAVSHTLRVGRRAFDHRLAVVCDSAREAASLLSSGELPPATRTSTQAPRVAFMFPGGGAHHARMGRELYASEPVFRAELDRCAELLVPHLGLDIRTEMFGEGSLERPTRGLPALFALEYALAKLWMAWGVVPGVMIGHSVGEYAAACLAGVFRLEDALALVALRGRLFETLPRGAMLGVALRPPALRALLDGMPEVAAKLSLAAINAPELCVVSGPSGAIEAFQERLVERGVESRRLHIDVAAHSGVVERIVGEFQQAVGSVRPSAPRLPFVSNLTGRLITTQEATDPHYWGRHLRETVRFSDGLALLLEEPELVLLEVGAGTTLSSLARSHPSRKHQPVLASLPHPRDPQPESRQVLTALGALWSHGVALDWAAFDAQRAPRRVSLPTYPFQRQRFWLDAPAGAHGAARAHALEGWFFVPSWRRSVPPPRRPMEHERCWVLFVDEGDVGSRLAEALRAEGRGVVTVRPGARFSQASDTSYTLEPSSPSDYSTLVRELERRGSWPGRVVHLWNLTRPDSPGDFARSFDSLVVLARVLGERPKAVRIDVVSSGLHEVSGEEVLQPRKALSLGPIRVAGKEYPGLRLRSIDVVWPSSAMAGDGLVARLRAELECGAEEAVIALRGAHRWVQAFEPVSLPAPEPASRRPRERGVYWITGGLGGLGLVLAEHLGRTLQARLVLTGRSAFPEREAWDRWLAEHGPDDRTSRTIHTLRGILSAGGEVLVLQADITDEKASRAVLERAEHAFGHVNGVIHAAGVFDVALLGDTTRERMERVLAPKVLGAEVLERVFSSRTLDFMAFCSSLNAVLGPPGLADYCAANAYLDALAARRARDGHFTVSIGWDGWREVGMAAAMRMPDLAWAGEGMGNADGVAAFERILARSLPQVLVSTGELSARLEAVARGSEPASGRASTPEASTTNPERESTHVAPRNDMERVLAGLWRMLLGVEVVGVHDNFVELGGHSLLGSRLLVQIRAAFDIALPLKTLFDKPTVAELAAHLSALMAARDMLPIEPLGADEEEERW